MRKLIACILSLLMVLAIASTVFAQGEIYNYRDFSPKLSDGTKMKKPLSNFSIAVKSPHGEIKTSVTTENNIDTDIVPGPVIQAAVGDTLVFADNSASRSGYKITAWDWQYWTEDKQVHELKSQIDKSLKLTIPGRYHFYLCVADNAPVNISDQWLWKLNWSDNGNHRAVKDLGHGMQGYWYFNEIIVEVAEGSPDFFPTPEGADTWQESYKTCAKTYTAMPGEDININFALHNAGDKQTTDFAATWFGSGWENPVWKVDDIALDKGSKQDFNLSIKVPAAGKETRLVFLANIDGKTPASEQNQENNIMIITVSSDIDLAATGIRSGVSGVPVPGQRYTGIVSFTNITKGYLTNVPIGAYNNGYRATLKDGSGNIVEVSDFGPSETKEFAFQWTLDTMGFSKLEECINVDPLPVVYPEKNYNNNKNSMVVTAAIKPESGQELRSRAHQQISIREFQGQPIIEREPNTCKWSDIIRTYLYPLKSKNIQYYITNDNDIDYSKTIAPPRPGGDDECGSYSVLKSWEITEGYISYPKQSSSFSFNNPVWQGEYAQEKLIIDQGGHRGKANWQNWFALDGFPMKNIRTGQYNGPAKNYNLTCDYTVKVVYDKTVGHVVCNDDGCWCVYKEYKNQVAYYHYKAAGSILVNGAGTTPQPAGYVDDWLKRHPGAHDPRKTYVYPEG